MRVLLPLVALASLVLIAGPAGAEHDPCRPDMLIDVAGQAWIGVWEPHDGGGADVQVWLENGEAGYQPGGECRLIPNLWGSVDPCQSSANPCEGPF